MTEISGSAVAWDAHSAFLECGLASLDLVEAAHALGRRTGVRLEPTTLFARPNMASLLAYLLERTGSPAVGAAAGAMRRSGSLPASASVCHCAARVPGGAGRRHVWPLVAASGDAVSKLPLRLELAQAAPHARGSAAQFSFASRGAFLSGIGRFDSALFGIAPLEAASMDPRQRMLLEVGYEAFHAGGPASKAPRADGVFLGLEASE